LRNKQDRSGACCVGITSAIPGINVVVGAELVAGLIYSARKFATDNL